MAEGVGTVKIALCAEVVDGDLPPNTVATVDVPLLTEPAPGGVRVVPDLSIFDRLAEV